jgi:hypothetical protein
MTNSIRHSFERFSAVIVQNTNHLKAGEVLEIHAGVGAFGEAARPGITIDGKPVKPGGTEAIVLKDITYIVDK